MRPLPMTARSRHRAPVMRTPASAGADQPLAAPRAGIAKTCSAPAKLLAHGKAAPAQPRQDVEDIQVGGVVAAEQDGAAGERASVAPARSPPCPCRCHAGGPRSPPCRAGSALSRPRTAWHAFPSRPSAPAALPAPGDNAAPGRTSCLPAAGPECFRPARRKYRAPNRAAARLRVTSPSTPRISPPWAPMAAGRKGANSGSMLASERPLTKASAPCKLRATDAPGCAATRAAHSRGRACAPDPAGCRQCPETGRCCHSPAASSRLSDRSATCFTKGQ